MRIYSRKIEIVNKLIRIITSICLLFIGLLFYCNLKSDTIITKAFSPYLIIKISNQSVVFDFIKNWGCDIIWSSSFYILLSAFYPIKSSLIIVSLFSLIIEMLQMFLPVLGTFDCLDIFFEILFVILIYLIDKTIYVRRKKTWRNLFRY